MNRHFSPRKTMKTKMLSHIFDRIYQLDFNYYIFCFQN